jgi:hypothetical protein
MAVKVLQYWIVEKRRIVVSLRQSVSGSMKTWDFPFDSG